MRDKLHTLFNHPAFQSLLGLLLVYAVFLPVRLERASWEDSLWVDEIFSLMVVSRPVEYIIGITTFDAHPPGFYLIVKAWVEFGKLFSPENPLLWARLPSVFAWIVTAAASWFAGRKLLGSTAGSLFCIALVGGAQMAYIARDIRNYSLAVMCTTIAFYVVLLLYQQEKEGGLTRQKALIGWGLYSIVTSAVLWLHLLSAVILFVIGVLWVLLSLNLGRIRSLYVWPGIIANAIAPLLFVPWLLVLTHQLEYLARTPTTWMTPANFTNFMAVFYLWFPFGRIGGIENYFLNDMLLAASFLSPLPVYALAISYLRKKKHQVLPLEKTLLLSAFFVAVSFVGLLWLLRFHDIAKVFHGSRYTVFALPMYVFALALCGKIACERLSLPKFWQALLLAPFFASGLIGQSISQIFELQVGVQYALRTTEKSLLPEEETVLYTFPSEVIPYFQLPVHNYDLRPISELDPNEEVVHVLHADSWLHIQNPEERIVYGLIKGEELADSTRTQRLPEFKENSPYVLYTLRNVRSEVYQRMMDRLNRVNLPMMEAAVSIALPEQQLFYEGFSVLEISSDGTPFIWGSQPTARIYFDKPLEPGEYDLKVRIFRHPYPEERVNMEVNIAGTHEPISTETTPGTHVYTYPVTISSSLQEPSVAISMESWQPIDFLEGSEDERNLTFLFEGAWFEPRDR